MPPKKPPGKKLPAHYEQSKKQMNACLDQLVHVPHTERVELAKPIWEKMDAQTREEEVSQVRHASDTSFRAKTNTISFSWL